MRFFLTRCLAPIICLGIATAAEWDLVAFDVGGFAAFAGGLYLWLAAIYDRRVAMKLLDEAISEREGAIAEHHEIMAHLKEADEWWSQIGPRMEN